MKDRGRREIHAALETTTERLAGEIHSPSDTAPDWSPFEWRIARAAAAMQGISGLLAGALRWRGPDEWHAFLAGQRAQMTLRDARAWPLRDALDAALRASGMSVVGLKGLSLRTFALYAPGERPMGDLDLLVAPGDIAALIGILDSLGYAPSYAVRRHAVFKPRSSPDAAAAPCGEHIDNPHKIELHPRVAERLPVREVDITPGLAPDARQPGIDGYRNPAALLRHLLLHAAGNMRANALRQIQLNDIARLGARLEPRDWEMLVRDAPGPCWWMYPPLALAERYYPGAIPPALLARTRAACPRGLRRVAERVTLSRVSWSNPRIPALPGLAWARSIPEGVAYARERFLPNRQERDDLAAGVATQPRLLGARWYGISRTERALRWLFARPRRVHTMLTVDAALRSEL